MEHGAQAGTLLRDQTLEAFARTYSAPPDVLVLAPGRAEVLGNHTDYNQGWTLSTNVAGASLLVAARGVPGHRVRVASLQEGGDVVEFSLGDEDALLASRDGGPTWVRYVRGVVWALTRAGHRVGGAELLVSSSIPPGGLSSSAALESALCRALVTLSGLEVPVSDQVLLCHQAESEYVGVPCGLLDQATVNLSHSWLLLSHRRVGDAPYEAEDVEVDLAGLGGRLVVGYDRESRHALVDGQYASRRAGCEAVVPVLATLLERPLTALRDVGVEELSAVWADLTRLVGRERAGYAAHVVGEDERVHAAVRALRRGDLGALGALLSQSGRSALEEYHLDEGAPELSWVLEHASGLCLGVRNMGGGFNATTLALVHAGGEEAYREELAATYRAAHGRVYEFLGFVPAPPTRLLGGWR